MRFGLLLPNAAGPARALEHHGAETLDVGPDVGGEEPLAAFTKAGRSSVSGIIEAIDREHLAQVWRGLDVETAGQC